MFLLAEECIFPKVLGAKGRNCRGKVGERVTRYDLLCSTNWALIKKQEFSDDEKQEIVNTFLSGIDTPETVCRFHARVKTPNDTRRMYPLFYIPPYNAGRKRRLITSNMPKTHILSANHYELEILRLLALWGSGNDKATGMVDQTLSRL